MKIMVWNSPRFLKVYCVVCLVSKKSKEIDLRITGLYQNAYALIQPPLLILSNS